VINGLITRLIARPSIAARGYGTDCNSRLTQIEWLLIEIKQPKNSRAVDNGFNDYYASI